MRERFRLQVLLVLSVITVVASGQNNTSSPYSRYGLNTTENVGYSMSGGMGGAGVALRSPYYINPKNPASYSALDSQNIVVEAGFFGKGTSLSDGSVSESASDANFQYFAMAFPVNRYWGSSFGVRPYTFVGYEYNTFDSTLVTGNVKTSYLGGGSINQVYWGNGFNITKSLSVGVSGSYLFGKIYHNRSLVFEDPTIISSAEKSDLYLHNLMFDFGVQYDMKLKSGGSVIWGATFTPYVDASSTFTSITNTALDTVTSSVSNPIQLPQQIGLGITYVKNKWILTADFNKENWSKNYFLAEGDEVTDKTRYSAGFQYLLDPFSRSFFKRLRYRGGVHYTDTNIVVNGNQVNEIGVSAGIGMPIRSIKTTLNFALELGKRGSTKDGMIRENYAKFMVSFALNDSWFHKRRFE